MKTIIHILLFLFSIPSTHAQEDRMPTHFMASLSVQVVYEGISNLYEYSVCEGCDTVFITARGAEILNQSAYRFEIFPLPKSTGYFGIY